MYYILVFLIINIFTINLIRGKMKTIKKGQDEEKIKSVSQ